MTSFDIDELQHLAREQAALLRLLTGANMHIDPLERDVAQAQITEIETRRLQILLGRRSASFDVVI